MAGISVSNNGLFKGFLEKYFHSGIYPWSIAITVLQIVTIYLFDRFGENVKCVSSLLLKWVITAFK